MDMDDKKLTFDNGSEIHFEGGDDETLKSVGTFTDQKSTLSMEDIQEAMRKVEDLMPKPRMNAILISERLPRGRSWIRDYKGKVYMIFNKQDLEAEFQSLKNRFPAIYVDERYELPAGQIGILTGVPILEDDALIAEILMEEIRLKFLLHRLQGMLKAGIIVFPPRVE